MATDEFVSIILQYHYHHHHYHYKGQVLARSTQRMMLQPSNFNCEDAISLSILWLRYSLVGLLAS